MAQRDRVNGERAAPAASRSALRRCGRSSLVADGGLSWGLPAIGAGRVAATDFETLRRGTPRFEFSRIGFRSAGQAQADDAVQSHGPRGHLARVARYHLCDRTADRWRQGPGRGHDAGCAVPDPLDGAVATVHPRDLLRADHARGERNQRAFPYRSPYHSLFWIRHVSAYAALRNAITTSPMVSVAIYLGLVVALL